MTAGVSLVGDGLDLLGDRDLLAGIVLGALREGLQQIRNARCRTTSRGNRCRSPLCRSALSGEIHVCAVRVDGEHRPAVLLGAARQHGSASRIVCSLDGEADRPSCSGPGRCAAVWLIEPGDLEDDHRLAVVARGLQLSLRRRQVDLGGARAGIGRKRCAAHPEGRAVTGARNSSGTPIAVRGSTSWSTSFHSTLPHRRDRRRAAHAWFSRKLPWNWWMPPMPSSLTVPRPSRNSDSDVERQILHVVDLALASARWRRSIWSGMTLEVDPVDLHVACRRRGSPAGSLRGT